MGHEAIVYGRIIGASWRVGERFTWTHDLNREALAAVPEDDDWPWLVPGIFALPAPYPQGSYRRQVIHFGLSIKDEPYDRTIWDVWLGKFERVLRGLYWWSAVAHLTTDFEPPRVFEWVPTEAAMGRLHEEPPQPVAEWVRSVRVSEQRHDWREQIRSRFPDWGTDAALTRWPENRARLSVGAVVRGEVIAHAPFGVWVDIAALHPALLMVPEMAPGRKSPNGFEDYPALGAVVEARIVSLGDRAEIALSQNPQSAVLGQ